MATCSLFVSLPYFKAAGFTNSELADIFDDWNKGDLESYLIEITANIFRQHDSITGQDLVDVILDRAGRRVPADGLP